MQSSARLRVTHLQRGPFPGHFSGERIFDDVRGALPADFDVRLFINPYPNRGLLRRLAAALHARRAGGDIRHVLGDAHFLAWLLPRRHTILTIFDCVSLERMTGIKRSLFKLLWYSWPMRRTARVTTLSHFTRESVLRWCAYPSDQIIVIPPPLSPEFRFAPARPHDQWHRILHIGGKENKNLRRVIEALDGLGVTLITIGRMDERTRAAIAARGIAHESHVDLSREELVKIYEEADILLFPSIYEGFGMPIVEAQAVGRPVVTSNIASMPEAAGGAACLVDPFDVESIRAGLLRVLGDPDYAASLVAAGVSNARKFEVDAIAGRYATLYRSLGSAAQEHSMKGGAGEVGTESGST